MALAFTTEKMASAQEAYSLQKLELLNATEALNSSWMDLTEAQREIDGLQEIMDNVHKSVEMLNQFGADAIPMLNADGGLEALLQIPERLITVEKAQEGLGDTFRNAFETFINWVREVVSKVVNFIRSHLHARFESLKEKCRKVKESHGSKSTESFVATESTKDAAGTITKFLPEFNKNIKLVVSYVTHVESSLNALARTPAEAKTQDEVKSEVEAIVFNNDSYLFKSEDLLKQIEESVQSLSEIELDGEIEESVIVQFCSFVESNTSVDDSEMIAKKLSQLETSAKDMSDLAGRYKTFTNNDKQVDILNKFCTGYRACVKDLAKCIGLMNKFSNMIWHVLDVMQASSKEG